MKVTRDTSRKHSTAGKTCFSSFRMAYVESMSIGGRALGAIYSTVGNHRNVSKGRPNAASPETRTRRRMRYNYTFYGLEFLSRGSESEYARGVKLFERYLLHHSKRFVRLVPIFEGRDASKLLHITRRGQFLTSFFSFFFTN